MKIVNSGYEVVRKEDFKTPYEFLERIGRVCYKSEDKITEGSAVNFCISLSRNKHYAMLEHYWVHCIYRGTPQFQREEAQDVLRYIHYTCVNGYTYMSFPLRCCLEHFNEFCVNTGYFDGITPFYYIFGATYDKFKELFIKFKRILEV